MTVAAATDATWKTLPLSWSGGTLNAEPVAWKLAGFDDSAWDAGYIPPDPNPNWIPVPSCEFLSNEALRTDDHLGSAVWLTRKEFTLAELPDAASVTTNVDDRQRVWLNGTLIVDTPGYFYNTTGGSVDILSLLVVGANCIAIEVTNLEIPPNVWSGVSPNPTMVQARVDTGPVGWDIYAAADLNGPILATLENARERMIRIEEDGTGVGGFVINRHSPEATGAILAKGNLVRVRIPEISTDYIGAFFIEQGDFNILESGEEGAEDLRFGGAGAFSYLGRARMWSEAYSTGLDTSDSWTQIWKTSKVTNPVGSAVVGGDATYLYVISATTRKIYKLQQSDRVIVRSSPALWSGSDNYAAGLGADPADSTILWVLEAPWSLGGSGNTKIRKVRISDWAILDTFDLGSAVQLTALKADATNLWCSRWDGANTVQKRSKADGSLTTAYSVSYNGVAQVNATGISVNGTNLAYWYYGKKRALIAAAAAPGTITDKISTTGISAFGGDWSTEGGNDFFYPVSYTADVVWKYQVTVATPHDPVDGEWRLDEGTPGAILARIMAETQHVSRPQQPVPDITYDFTFAVDSDGNAWASHPGTIEFTARIGDFVHETALRLVPFGVTLQMSPALELQAYNDTDFGVDRTSATFAAGKVRVEGAINVAEALRRRMDDRRVDSHMLVGGDGGTFAVATDADLGYVREGFLSTNLSDLGALEGTGDAELARERRDADAQAVVIPWGDDEAAGLYMPGPAWTNGHYWVGDTIRVHTGTGEFDLVEQDRDVKAITIEELENGDWNAVADLASVFIQIYDPIAPPAPSSIGGTSGAGAVGGATVAATVIVKDSENGESYSGKTIESDDWGVSQPGTGRVAVTIKRRRLSELPDVELDSITDGQGIAWDSALEAWVPADLAGEFLLKYGGGEDTIKTHGNAGATETIDPADGNVHTLTLDADCTITLTNPTAAVGATIEVHATQDGTGGWTITWPGSVTWIGTATPGSTAAGTTAIYILESLDGGTSWLAATVGGGAVSPLTTKGDLWSRDASDDVRVPVGINGYPLVANSGAAPGVSWAAISVVAAYPFHAEPLCDSSGPILTATGDVIMVTGVPN